jgi:glycosyltransferase involved in cell wall biosynthesis
MRLDIIIPTLNEADFIASTLKNVFANASDIGNISVWVSDCASADATLDEARKFPVNIPDYDNPPTSRSAAMNFAADRSSGDVLMFLHADALLPLHYDKLIFEALSQPRTVGGAFKVAFNTSSIAMRFIIWLNTIRYSLSGLYYGDQALFFERSAFVQAGKYPNVNLMEDSLLCRRIKKIGRLKLIPERVLISPRRFLDDGYWRVCFFDIRCSVLDSLGMSCERYAESYKRNNRNRGANTQR